MKNQDVSVYAAVIQMVLTLVARRLCWSVVYIKTYSYIAALYVCV